MRGRTFIFFLLLLPMLLTLPVAGVGETRGIEVEGEAIGQDWQRFLDAIPAEIRELLPDGFFEKDMTVVGEGVREAGTLSAVLGVVGRALGISIKENLLLLASISGVLVLAATVGALLEKRQNGAFTLLMGLVTSLLFFTLCAKKFDAVVSYFEVIGDLCVAMLPLMGVLYAMGGNIGAAVANQGVMSAFLVVLERVLSASVVPVASLCVLLALLDAASPHISLRSLGVLLRRTFTWGVSLLMLVLSFVLGVQQTLAKGADTLALRTVRFAAGSFLPVVGGSVGESLKTVAGSVEYLRATVGTGGILVVFLAFLPIFLLVLCTRITLLLGGAVAGMLSLPREERLLGEFASVFGYFLAIIAALFVMVTFSLTLMAHCASAVG